MIVLLIMPQLIENLRLADKSIAVPGHSTVQDFLLRKLLKDSHLREGDVKVIVIKPPEMIPSLKEGQIDAFIAWEPHVAKSLTSGVGRVLVTSGEIWPYHPCCVLVAERDFIKKSPQSIRRILKAHIKATDFINEHMDEAVEMGMKFTGMDINTIKAAMSNIEFDYIPSTGGEIEYVTFLNRLGYIKIKDPGEFTNSLINTDIINSISPTKLHP